MFDLLRVRINQGRQAIRDIKKALPPDKFRALPVIGEKPCREGCSRCVDVCPADAVRLDPVRIDLGRCIFCPECGMICPEGILNFTNNIHTSATEPGSLVITRDNRHPVIRQDKKIKRLFRRSLKLRSVSAGGCNGCELELNALSNVNFDMGRFGIEFTASPRHADGIVLTGPVSENMAYALKETIRAVPDPKIIVLAGACALSGGLFKDSPAVDRSLLKELNVDLYIPGCPPHPLTFIRAMLDYLGR